jgi:hypothetical protein
MGGAFALALIMIFFWMPESAYMREALNIDTGDTNVTPPPSANLLYKLTPHRSLWKEKEYWSRLSTLPTLESSYPNRGCPTPRNCFHTAAM